MVKNDINYTRELAEFVPRVKYEDLSGEIVQETKRLILDVLGCALGAYAIGAGRIIAEAASVIGGEKDEITVIGSSQKTSCAAAAFANAELAKALDVDDAFFNFTHLGASIVSSALAVSEQICASGEDLITAVAIGYDISARIGLSMPRGQRLVGEPPALRVEAVKSADFNWHSIGVSATAGKLLGLNRKKLATAFGIAGINVPIFSSLVFKGYSSFVPMTKYGCHGTNAMNGIIAALLAERGYTASQTILDDEFGLWKLMDVDRMYPEFLSEDLGKKWWISDVSYKIYPCCRVWHSALDAFYTIIGINSLKPDEIKEVLVMLHPRFHGVFDLLDPEITDDPISFQFCGPLNFSMAAFNIKPGPDWQDMERLKNHKIKEFAKKVKLLPDTGFLRDVYEEIGNEPKAIKKLATLVQINTNDGRSFSESRDYAKGDPWHENTRLSDEELVDKFKENARRLLGTTKIDAVVNSVYKLERLKNIRTFTCLFV